MLATWGCMYVIDTYTAQCFSPSYQPPQQLGSIRLSVGKLGYEGYSHRSTTLPRSVWLGTMWSASMIPWDLNGSITRMVKQHQVDGRGNACGR